MDDRTFNVWPGGVAKRAAITVAASAVLMAGLHYAPLRGFSPGAILLGHPEEVAAIPASPEGRPNIRFIAIPAREAFPPAAVASAGAPAVVALPAEEPASLSVIPTPRPTFLAETAKPGKSIAPAPMTAVLMRPTPRPALEPTREAASADMSATPTAPTRIARLPSQDVRLDEARPAPELELVSELVPEPRGDERSFELADLVPSPRGMLRGVATVGRTVGHGARYAVTEVADGARAIVGR